MSKGSSLTRKIRGATHQVRMVLEPRRSKGVALLVAIVYLSVYFWLTELITYVPYMSGDLISLFLLDDWPEKIFRLRGPFNWEPIGILTIGSFDILIAIPNIVFGTIVGLLVGANLSVSYYTYTHRTLCNIDPTRSVISAVPALLTGFACCGPTLLLSLGIASASLTIAFIAVLPFLFPLALGGLLISLLWSGWKMAYT